MIFKKSAQKGLATHAVSVIACSLSPKGQSVSHRIIHEINMSLIAASELNCYMCALNTVTLTANILRDQMPNYGFVPHVTITSRKVKCRN